MCFNEKPSYEHQCISMGKIGFSVKIQLFPKENDCFLWNAFFLGEKYVVQWKSIFSEGKHMFFIKNATKTKENKVFIQKAAKPMENLWKTFNASMAFSIQ